MGTDGMRLYDSVDVSLDEGPMGPVLVGTLRASFMGGRVLAGTSFEYAPSYLARPTRYAISPDLPLVAGRQFSGADVTLFGAFADVTPDDWGIQLIDAEYSLRRDPAGPRVIGEFDHLVQQNDFTRMGALRFRALTGGSAAESGASGWLTATRQAVASARDVRRIAEAVTRFEHYEATAEDIEILGVAGSSLGGARPKATVRDSDGSLWLLKLPSNRDRRIDVEAWEATALDLAQRAGLRVPRRRLLRFAEGRSSLLVERFDRAPGGVARVGYMSAMSAMQLGPQNQHATYADFADTVDRVVPTPASDLWELFGRIALNVLIGNVDDHWKNHGFIRTQLGSDSSWQLSPLFDINPTRAGSRVRSRRITDTDDSTNRDIRLLVEGCGVYGLTAAEAARILTGVLEAVGDWREVAAQNGIAVREAEHMASAFDETQFAYAAAFVARHAQ